MSSSASTLRTPSIREIARVAKVAPSTVSRAFNADRSDVSISPRTRAKIDKVCKKLNYYPNVHATRLFANRSNAIGLIVPPWGSVLPDAADFSDPNLSRTLAGLTQAANEQSQELVLLSAEEQFSQSKKYLHMLRGKQVDGMVVWGARPKDSGFITEIAQEGWPIVLANSFADITGVAGVHAANRQGSGALASHLIELGHTRIGYITGPSTSSVAVDRLSGFQAACRAKSIQLAIEQGEFSFESGRQLANAFLDSDSPPTAIAAASDLMALGAIEAIEARGLGIPKDISVVGADDVFPYHKPRLTTFRAPMEEIGQEAMKMLLEQIGGNPTDRDREVQMSSQCVVPVKMVEGQTAGGIKNYEL